MLLAIIAILFGLVILTWGTDKFLDSASFIAQKLGISPFLIGLTIIAFGTSAPEMIVSLLSTLDGAPGLAIGNVIGSNISNIGLGLGLAAIIVPIPFIATVLTRELAFYLAITVVMGLLLMNNVLSVRDGVMLLGLLGLFIILLIKWQKSTLTEEIPQPEGDTKTQGFWFVIGLLCLLGGSKSLVWGAVALATLWGVSDVIIGLTIVALGTSLPEIATTVGSALKKQHGLAFGNILGSNILNSLVVMPIPALLAPGVLPEGIWFRDFGALAVISLVFAGFAFWNRQHIGRIAGFCLLFIYLGYTGLLIVQAASG